MPLDTAMQKTESAFIAIVIGIGFPFLVTYLVSGGTSSSFLIPCTSSGSGVCQVGTIAGNVITEPEILVSTANLGITLLEGILIIFASIFGIWGAIEYVGARGGAAGPASSSR